MERNFLGIFFATWQPLIGCYRFTRIALSSRRIVRRSNGRGLLNGGSPRRWAPAMATARSWLGRRLRRSPSPATWGMGGGGLWRSRGHPWRRLPRSVTASAGGWRQQRSVDSSEVSRSLLIRGGLRTPPPQDRQVPRKGQWQERELKHYMIRWTHS
jgi:hypothetical protein